MSYYCVIIVSKDDIDRQDYSRVEDQIRDHIQAVGQDICGACEIMICGYDADPREVWDIPEVCDWMHGSISRIPWAYILRRKMPAVGWPILLMCNYGFDVSPQSFVSIVLATLDRYADTNNIDRAVVDMCKNETKNIVSEYT